MIGLSLIQAEFIKSGDIVSDSVSGLEWQDDVVGSSMLWEAAITQCEDLTLGGHSDWRLPNINELTSIVDRSKVNSAITGFANTAQYSVYWSSTTYEYYKTRVWTVRFSTGSSSDYSKGNNNYVRCVRDGQ